MGVFGGPAAGPPSSSCRRICVLSTAYTLTRRDKRAAGGMHVFTAHFLFVLLFARKTSALGEVENPRGWPTYVPLSYILHTMQSDTQDIFARVTSGDSYHLFTACTPSWTSTNVDCDPTAADTGACLPSFLPPFPVSPSPCRWAAESPGGRRRCTTEVNRHTQVSIQRPSCSTVTRTNN